MESRKENLDIMITITDIMTPTTTAPTTTMTIMVMVIAHTTTTTIITTITPYMIMFTLRTIAQPRRPWWERLHFSIS